MRELGELIRSARQQKGVSLSQASAETRIRRQYLDAIEDGDFRIFPGEAYATGFLRNYAGYLGLNQDEILQTYHAVGPSSAISIAPATTVGVERLKRRSRRRATWVFAGVVMVCLAAVLIWKYDNEYQASLKAPVAPKAISGLPAGVLTHPPDGDQAPPLQSFRHAKGVIRVRAVHTAWIHVVVDGRQVYWSPLHVGATRKWRGKTVAVSAHRGTAFRLWVDGIPVGRMSHKRGHVTVTARPHTWHRTT